MCTSGGINRVIDASNRVIDGINYLTLGDEKRSTYKKMLLVVMKKMYLSFFFVRYSVSSDFSEDARNTLFLPVSFVLAWKYRACSFCTRPYTDRIYFFGRLG